MAKSQAKLIKTEDEARAEIKRLRALTSWTADDVACFLLEPGKAETQYADPQRDGLIHCIYANGSRLWRYRYKLATGERKAIKYGKYGTPSRIIISYEKAKVRWAKDNATFLSGGDPKPKKAEPEEKKEEHTFRQLVDLWATTSYVDFGLEGTKSKENKLSELKQNVSKVRNESGQIGYLWDKPTAKIGVKDVLNIIDPMKARGSYEYAKKIYRYLVLVAKFARTKAIPFDRTIFEQVPCPVAPAREPRQYKCGPAVKDLTLEQAAYMWHEIGSAHGNPYLWHVTALELVLGQRQGEINGMLRDEIDLKNKVWTIPWVRLKTRYRSRKKSQEATEKPHVLPLPDIAIDIIRDALRRTDGNVVFPAAKTGNPITTHDVNCMIRDAIAANRLPGLPRFTTHALRRTVITQVRKIENRERLLDAAMYMHHVLGHVDGENDMAVIGGGNAVTDLYDKNQYMTEKKIALDAWGAFIDDLVGHSANKALKRAA